MSHHRGCRGYIGTFGFDINLEENAHGVFAVEVPDASAPDMVG